MSVNRGTHPQSGGCGSPATPIKEDNGEVTFVQPMLSLWDEPAPDHRSRVVANSEDRVAWLRARSRGVTATDVARLSSVKAVQSVAYEKLNGSGFGGNAYTDHGRAREPEIARWVLANHGIAPSSTLFHAHGQPLHLATPDGVVARGGAVELAEIKTTSSVWRTIPRSYLRQIWWQQYVLGADRTLLVWEQHQDFVPVPGDPLCRWIDRDDNEIHILVGLANRLLDIIRH
ncbi:MAG: recombinase [Glaciihabitans sp.]|nr:recombinase [Glaciihabitans sp.]